MLIIKRRAVPTQIPIELRQTDVLPQIKRLHPNTLIMTCEEAKPGSWYFSRATYQTFAIQTARHPEIFRNCPKRKRISCEAGECLVISVISLLGSDIEVPQVWPYLSILLKWSLLQYQIKTIYGLNTYNVWQRQLNL